MTRQQLRDLALAQPLIATRLFVKLCDITHARFTPEQLDDLASGRDLTLDCKTYYDPHSDQFVLPSYNLVWRRDEGAVSLGNSIREMANIARWDGHRLLEELGHVTLSLAIDEASQMRVVRIN